MPNDARSQWPEFALTELFEVRSGLSKPASEFGSGFPFVTFKDVLDHYFLPETLGSLVRSSDAERELCSVRRGDVFLTRTSETQEDLGMSCVALQDYDAATFNGFTKRLRPKDPNRVVPEYAAYFLRSPRFRAEMSAFSSLSTRASLNNDMLSRLRIALPERTVQEAIGYTLKSLDDKIEQNRRTGRGLEGLARRVFKAWFVDFEPVKAKAAGAAGFPGMPAAAFAALPDRLVDSEQGPLPEGWSVVPIGSLIDLEYGKALKAETRRAGSVPVFGSNGQVGWHDTALVSRAGIVVGRKGNPGTVSWASSAFFPIDTTFYVVPKSSDLPLRWLFYTLETADLPQRGGDSAVPGLNRTAALTKNCLRPPMPLITSFIGEIRLLLEMSELLGQESAKLAALRDYLLPRLLSGRVRVREARGW